MPSPQNPSRRRPPCRRLLPALTLCCLLPARAADPTSLPVQALVAPAGTAPQEQLVAAPVELEPVNVTGELVQREATRTATSVSVKTGKQLERSTVTDVYELMRATPNVSVQQGFYNIGDFTLRGISTYGGGSNTGQNVYGTTTAIVLDGVGLPRSALTASDLSAFDLQQVEIFRGPQSTNQGRNAMAGAVVINTRAPEIGEDYGFDLRGRVAGYTDAGYQGAVAAGATLLPGIAGARFVSDHRSSRGDLDNVTRVDPDWARDQSHGNRLRLALTPFGPDSRYRVDLSGVDSRRVSGGFIVEQINESRREATDDQASNVDSTVRLLAINQQLALDARWSLQAATGLFRSNYQATSDTGYTAANDGFYQSTRGGHGLSQELRARYVGERLRGTVGAYGYRGTDDEHFYGEAPVLAYVNFFLPICGVPGVCEPLGDLTGNLILDARYPTETTNLALFGEADWQLLPRLTLTAGLRLDRERNHRVVIANASGTTASARAVAAVVQQAGVVAPNGEYELRKEFSALLPKAALSYQLIEDWYLSASYGEGYRAGGSGYNPQSGRRYEIEAEYTQNYELALKGRIAPLGAEVALNLFHTDWRDMQVATGSGTDYYVDNAGRSKIDGGEFEFRLPLLRALRLSGGAGYTLGRFTDYVATDGDYSGNPLPKAPRWTGALALEWSPTPNLLLRPDLSYRGRTPSQPDNAPSEDNPDANHQLDAAVLVNFKAQWRVRKFTLFLAGTNLGNEQYRTDAVFNEFSQTSLSALGTERRLYAGLDWSL